MHLTWSLIMLRRYDFKCTQCGHVEEQWVEADETLATCYECGHTAVRIISSVSSHFKGVGWPDADDKWAKDHERAAHK